MKPATLVDKFKVLLKEGANYIIQNFCVEKESGEFKDTNYEFKISFPKSTIVNEIDAHEISNYLFNWVLSKTFYLDKLLLIF